MKLRILIIDDERQARRLLHNLLLEKYTDAEIHEASNLLDGIEIIKKEAIELVLSDINMPVHSGLEIVNYFPPDQMDFKLIFTTVGYLINSRFRESELLTTLVHQISTL